MPKYVEHFNINGTDILVADSEARSQIESIDSRTDELETKATAQVTTNTNLSNRITANQTNITATNNELTQYEGTTNSRLALAESKLNALSNANNDIATLQAQQAVLEDRMDSFSTLTEGSTTGDAELIDIRTAGNGVTYSSAGDSVRGEYIDLANVMKLANSGLVDVPNSFPTGTWNGGTISWNKSTQEFTIVGAPTTNTFNADIYNNTSALPDNIKAGEVYNVYKTLSNAYINYMMYIYVNGNPLYTYNLTNMNQVLIPDDATGLVFRLQVPSGYTGTLKGIIRLGEVAYECWGGRKYFYALPSGGGSTYVQDIINTMLSKYKDVKLITGNYYINDEIEMPENSSLTGCGYNTLLQQFSYSASGIIMSTNCSIGNMRILGVSSTIASVYTDYAGIKITGTDETAPYVLNNKINDCWIDGWAGGGIRIAHTGYWCANSATIKGCTIKTCYAGIWCDEKAEYNRISECLVYGCWVGVRNDGGNNVYVNCTLTENKIAFYIAAENKANSGHGSAIGCTLNHNDSNNGYAVAMSYCSNGFTFVGCQIWYGKILYEYANEGILFDGCQFGGGTPEIINNASAPIFLMNCLFNTAPTITGSVSKANCYTLTGTAV